MKQWVITGLLLSGPFQAAASGEALPVDPRYGRASLGYQLPTIAQVLAQSAPKSPWRFRVAQDLSVFIGAETFSYQLLAKTRFKPGFDCLAANESPDLAKQWVDRVLKAHLREKQDVDRMSAAIVATERFAPGPAEDCGKTPTLLGTIKNSSGS